MICAQPRPARLKVFDADTRAIPRAAAASETVRKGTCSAPGRVIGAWISSARIQASCSAASAASASSSARDATDPVGLCGLQRSIARAPAANAPRDAVEVEIAPPASGTSTISQPASGTRLKNGW